MTKKVQKNGKSDLVCNEKIKKQKTILLFVIIFIVSLIMCFAFLQPHYPTETYKIVNIGYTRYSIAYFLKEGRPFTAILSILADFLHIPVEIYSVTSFIIALIFLSIAIVMLYNMLKNKIKSNSKRHQLNNFINFIFNYNELFCYRIHIFYGM